MGMFDSFYDLQGNEWQTKAFECALEIYELGDEVGEDVATYQVKVLGGTDGEYLDSFATIRNGRLESVPDDRDESLGLLDYHGGWLVTPEGD